MLISSSKSVDPDPARSRADRDPDGVALSSRNARLDEEARIRAATFARLLRQGPDAASARRAMEAAGGAVTVETVEDGASFLLEIPLAASR